MSIIVRNMTQEDVAFLVQLEQELFSDAWTELSLINTLHYRPDTSFVAELDGKPAGYLFFMAAADEGELLRIGVAPGHRRQGIGRKLMEHMDHFVQDNGIYSVWLEVRESNEPARMLYEQSGFTVQGYRRKYYHKPEEDAVIMSRSYPCR
ncbi:MAG: ribosomal protein S18-alanine N-acetyltransferase [Lachnospiraceae bacterium]|nr:ribosomal protein S18-alanine N-acetyltransferase [Lachnospiraceae bacterium]MDY4970817.1 ribosomal protein S18-alanine N-acetyltransferase [Lachnospiraceae bacterium]